MIYKGEIPFVRLMVPLVTGIIFGYIFSNELLLKSSVPLALTSLLALVFLIIAYKRFSVYRFKWIAGFIVHSFLLIAGYWLTVSISGKYDSTHYSLQKADAFLAEIISEPKKSASILRVEALISASYRQGEESTATGKIIISIQTDSGKTSNLKYGDVLLMAASYNSIDPPYNPGEFDYRSYLANHQIYYQAFLNQRQIHLVESDQGNPLISFALKLRKELVDKFYRYLQDGDSAAFASTLILGYRAELSREVIEAYSKTGTMHVLSVSGMHVGIVFMVLSALLKFMNKTQSTRLLRAFLIISIIWFYALLTGFSAPACRASFMLSFIVLGKALNKTQNTYNLIAISAFFLLLYNPFYLVDAGFQLSYLAVTGLVYFHPKIYQSLYVKNKLLDYVWSYCALSIAAQLATFPFSIYYFHQFPMYFLFSNLFIVFPVAIIMYAGILFLFIPFPVVLYHIGKTLSWLIDFTNRILYYIENLPFSSWDGIWINSAECVLICLVIICMCLGVSFGYRKLMLPISVLLILLCSSFSWNWIRNGQRHEIVFYNLRKKTGIAYIFKERSIIISDVDQSDKLMSFSILPTVKSKGSHEEIFYPVNKVFAGGSYSEEQNFYQFGNYKILRWDRSFENMKFSKSLTVDAVLISGNPRITIDQIASCLKFTRIIIDGKNPDYKIQRWGTDARKMNAPYYVLKKNPALVIKL